MAEWGPLAPGGEWGALSAGPNLARHRYTFLGPFGRIDLAAALTDSVLELGESTNLSQRLLMPFPGMLRAISARSVDVVTGGSATFSVATGGANTTLSCVLDTTNTQEAYSTTMTGPTNFAAGSTMAITVTTTAGWLPVTADVIAGIWVEFS